MRARLNARFVLACLWSLFLIRGFFYIAVLPIWEGFDEWAHYAFVQSVATDAHWLIHRTDRVSREVEVSLQLAPWRPGEAEHSAQHAAYWRLTDTERATREQLLRSVPSQLAREPALHDLRSYEAQQAPLYYWLFAPLYKLAGGLSFLARVWFLRLASLVLASSVIPIGFLVARKAFGEDLPAFGAIAILASTPQLMIIVTRISNDSLALPMGALLLYLMLRCREDPSSLSRGVALGISLGLALLTKAYFLAFVPPVLVCIILWIKPKRASGPAMLLLACALGISAWWYIRNWLLTRSLSGELVESAAAGGARTFFCAILRVNWLGAIDFGLLSQIWLGNWSFLVVRSWMYHFFYILVAGAGIGLIVHVVHLRRKAEFETLLLLAGVSLSFFAAVGYHSVRSFQTQGFSGSFGYYAFPAIVAELLLFIIGLESIAPAVAVPLVIPFITLCLAALELFALNFIALPYYAGFTASLPNGGVHAMKLSQLQRGGLQVLLARLTLNKPIFFSATTIAALWIVFVFATLFLIALSAAAGYGRWRRASSHPGSV